MSQTFHRSTNVLARVSIFGSFVGVIAVLWFIGAFVRSPYVTEAGVVRDQPIPFSHKRHVGQMGIDCRYCHTSSESSSFAGVPSTKTCMTCHSQIWLESPMLEPVRASYRTGESIAWTRVNDLPGFVHFDHSVHVAKGVGCTTCHGPVNEMPLMWRQEPLQMEWCLACHRNPQPALRPRQEVFNPDWEPPEGVDTSNEAIRRDLVSCSVCHQ